MDINYHYFAVKTLACTAGFSEEDAQTIAYYSQQVDDFTKSLPMWVRKEPPQYFFDKKYAKKVGKDLWQILPHPTGIDVIQSMEKHYRHTTLAAFHFIPAEPLEEIKAKSGFTRADYRCVRADDEQAKLVQGIVRDAVKSVQENKCEKSLMELGMALHTYADTYAHCGYSGLDGWENRAIIKKAYNQMTGKEEVDAAERYTYELLPHIGHGNTGHVPDVCTYQIDVAMRKDENDTALTLHIVRDNLKEFLKCSRKILEIMCRAARTNVYEEIEWEKFSAQLAEAMQLPTKDETKEDELIAHWKAVFPDISYAYDKHERLYHENALKEVAVSAELGLLEEIEEESIGITDVTDAFYMYNELAYCRAELVTGTAELLEKNAQILTEKHTLPDTVQKSTCDGQWIPQTELGLAVYTAGFEYNPDKDIICSTMNNVQRAGGYCKKYDDVAITISSVIDCEPIYFTYDGYDWMIELWKGQYGIETGCEIGLYYREQGKPLSVAEETLLGKWYRCVPDERMLDMRLTLKKDGKEMFSREWTKHWWLTGFHWGVYSEPSELSVAAGIRFPNREMQQAFCQGLIKAGYSYEEPDECTVEFSFGKPKTKQPAVPGYLLKFMEGTNHELVTEYNRFKKKYGITCNDPDVIDRVINQHAGVREKKLYEKMIHYYNRKSKLKKEAGRNQ